MLLGESLSFGAVETVVFIQSNSSTSQRSNGGMFPVASVKETLKIKQLKNILCWKGPEI